ncbi:hypothetical protein R70723_06860 [Paenibacillus sp. FSL R7-0273]|nr:hypothetical protein R70723_06860 [Paenibacillus sp. FSL R7-0273]OMF95164.1 hypothetical protein BK144_06405 [Paenibacillus sp. FSL R7-0273]
MKPRRLSGYLDYAVKDNVIFPLLLVNEALFSALIDANEAGTVQIIHRQRKNKYAGGYTREG